MYRGEPNRYAPNKNPKKPGELEMTRYVMQCRMNEHAGTN
jgi:hypothetical protein